MKDVSSSSKGATIIVENIGGYVAPFDVAIEYADGRKETLHQTPSVWKTNQKTTSVKLATKKKIQAIVIDGGIFMDANTKNNSWKAK